MSDSRLSFLIGGIIHVALLINAGIAMAISFGLFGQNTWTTIVILCVLPVDVILVFIAKLCRAI